jgi:hypothetical protein
VGTNSADATIVALVSTFQANEDFQAQEAVIIGNLGPISINPQGYNCSITLSASRRHIEQPYVAQKKSQITTLLAENLPEVA